MSEHKKPRRPKPPASTPPLTGVGELCDKYEELETIFFQLKATKDEVVTLAKKKRVKSVRIPGMPSLMLAIQKANQAKRSFQYYLDHAK